MLLRKSVSNSQFCLITVLYIKKIILCWLLAVTVRFLYIKICDLKVIACSCFTWITNFNSENTNCPLSKDLSEHIIQSEFGWSFGSQWNAEIAL